MCREKAKTILQEENLRISKARVELLTFFLHHPVKNDLGTIQRYFSRIINRVTIYRTLNFFVEHGFLTKIHSTTGKAYYIFHASPSEMHPHLKCRHCDAILCLPALPEGYLNQLKPFKVEEMPFLLEGTCEDCAKNQPD